MNRELKRERDLQHYASEKGQAEPAAQARPFPQAL